MSFLYPQREGSDRGASIIEYALMISLIGVVALAGTAMVGHRTEDKFDSITEAFDGPVVVAADHIDDDLADDEADASSEEEPPGSETDSGDSSGGSGGSVDEGDAGGAGDEGGSGDSKGEGGTEPATEIKLDGSETSITASRTEITEWKENKKGGKGEWAAAFDFQNEWTADQYIVVEVTKTDEKGKTSTEHVKLVVPAGGSASLEIDGNSLTVKDGDVSGVITVDVVVVSVSTFDEAGDRVSYDIKDGQTATATAPATP